jgi:hypothetical protein
MTATPLQRAIGRAGARRSQAAQRCGLCAAVVPDDHRHLLDVAKGEALCACPACILLFDRDAAGRYLLIPKVRTRLTEVMADALDVPVGLAFFVKQADGAVLAHYPSPLGTTQSQVDPDTWRAVEQGSATLASMAPHVEAYLVRAGTAARAEHWIVPVDDCYRLVAVIRQHWTGMAGGSRVWQEVARFFADLSTDPRQE